MALYTLIIWIVGLGLEGILLSRTGVTGWRKRYPLLFLYLGCVFLQDIVFLFLYYAQPISYRTLYWYAQFFSLALGCGVCWELFRSLLEQHPAVGRVARSVLCLVLALVASKALADGWLNGSRLSVTVIVLERNLRTVQAVALIFLALLLLYFAIPVNRSQRGVALGYGLFVGTSIIDLTAADALGSGFHSAWVILQPLFYLAVLCIWCFYLWSYQMPRATAPAPLQPPDYRSLADRTRKSFAEGLSYLRKNVFR
jgi:hypothetical protein